MRFFTSITNNYLPKARVLAKSVKRHHPDAVFHVMLCDEPPAGLDLAAEPFDHLIRIKDLGIPAAEAWIFKHSVVELCTAVKGAVFSYLFKTTGADKIIYFDPDILVLHPLDELADLLDRRSVILTPHQVAPEQTLEAVRDNEIVSLRHGVYNLGFLAVKGDGRGRAFIDWWRDRLLAYCYDDIPGGLFTDQKWVDLAPAFFDGIHILRDKSYNVATWNLTHRPVASRRGQLLVEGLPIKFYHFSGLDSGAQRTMLKKYGNHHAALFELRENYIRALAQEGQGAFGELPCAYSFYSDGAPIKYAHRLYYRTRPELMNRFPTPGRITGNGEPCYYHWLRRNAPEGVFAGLSDADAARYCLDMVLNSRSWKITRPLRRLSRWLRKRR